MPDDQNVDWRKSSISMGNGNCVEVACGCDDDEPIRGTLGRAEYIVEVEATPEDIAGVALSVRDERVVTLAARLEHALDELSSLRDHRARWGLEKARADKAEAERDAKLSTKAIGRSLVEMRSFAQRETTRADRAEAQVAALQRELAEVTEQRDIRRQDCDDLAEQSYERLQRAHKAEATIERVRRMAQVWVDIRPTYPTANREGHVMAYAGEQIIAALDARPDDPEEIRRLADAYQELVRRRRLAQATTEETNDEH